MPMKNPVHPGAFVKEMVIEAYGLETAKAARILGMETGELEDLLAGRIALTAEHAARLGKAFGIDSELLVRMQHAHDLARLEELDECVQVERYDPHTA